jgi:hypothetical protein
MRNEEAEDAGAALEPAEDAGAEAEDAAAAMILDRLDSAEDFGAPDEPAHDPPPLSRPEIDRLVDRVLDEELKLLSGSAPRPRG